MKTRPARLLRLIVSVVLPLGLLSSQDPQQSPTFRTEANHVRVDIIELSGRDEKTLVAFAVVP